MKKWWLIVLFYWLAPAAEAQRNYSPQSVLSQGNWYKIAIDAPGVYKLDLSFLNSLGLQANGLASSTIRVYGNGGGMLPEANNTPRPDDLTELAIGVMDGGDGILNANDFIYFYAPGPHHWLPGTATGHFTHVKNIYSEQAFYFITVGGQGKRVPTISTVGNPSVNINSYDYRYYYELDSVNFLSSGKQWFGEEFSDAPGKSLNHFFPIKNSGLLPGPVTIESSLVSRSIGAPGVFDIRLNDQPVQQISIPAVGAAVDDLFGREQSSSFSASLTQDTAALRFSFVPGSFNAQGWLNWFRFFGRSLLNMPSTGMLDFRDRPSVGQGVGQFSIANARDGLMVWDISSASSPIGVEGNLTGTNYIFRADCSVLKEYLAFYPTEAMVPQSVGRVPNQNLHQAQVQDYLLVAHPSLLAEAERLAEFHRNQHQLRCLVVSTEQVYNEFSSGTPDPVAIRDFVKMYYDKAGELGDTVKYLLLLGDASFDYKSRLQFNTNLVPGWQSLNSLDPLSTYVSDDFFGFLEDGEDINSGLVINTLDVGIGRIPAANPEQAANFVNKVMAYHEPESLGPWRNQSTYIADDEDLNLHLDDAEIITRTDRETNKLVNQTKIYLDAYRQESSPGGRSYPQVNDAINNQVLNGTLIWNYNGHGGPFRLAEETIIDQAAVNSWQNPFKLPLFITATCDFAPYDNPTISSLGEDILLRPKTGGIALMTTTRLVFANSNRIMNNNYLRFLLDGGDLKNFPTLGQAVRLAKNFTYQTSGDVSNNRKFTLLGDPAMRLAFPRQKVTITSINGLDPAQVADTLKATDKIIIEGEVQDVQGNRLSDFSGTVYPTLFDKVQIIYTLANDPGSQVVGFPVRQNILYKGKASVRDGRFSFTFKMPRDIQLNVGNGRLSLYAENGSTDANGIEERLLVGGLGNGAGDDKEGPDIKAFLNDESFVDGSLTNDRPILLLKLADSSGINTAGTGIGHDIIATLDDDNRRYFVLNEFYEAALDNYQEGAIRFQLPELEAGPHSLKIKAWDVVNNSSEVTLHFVVGKEEELMVERVLNYPNPFSNKTNFWFTHNQPGRNLQVTVQIFTMRGQLIKTLKKTINTPGNRSSELEWDARDDYGDKVGRGVYFYRLKVSSGAHHREVIEKLFIF